MKKTLSLLLVVIMIFTLAFAMTACGEKEEQEAGMPNPMVEYSSLDEINDACGCSLVKPDRDVLTDEKYFVIDCEGYKIAEYQFTIDRTPFSFRYADTSEDISGIYDGENTIFAKSEGDDTVMTDTYKASRWFSEGQYCLATTEPGDISNDSFKELADKMKEKSGAVDWSETYAMLEGDWQDTFSERCTMTLKNEGEYMDITVHWGDSYASYAQWDMTAVAYDDGTLNYSDCKESYITMNEDGDIVSNETKKIDPNGYFVYNAEDKILSWEGASEDSCKDCRFKKIEYVEL